MQTQTNDKKLRIEAILESIQTIAHEVINKKERGILIDIRNHADWLIQESKVEVEKNEV